MSLEALEQFVYFDADNYRREVNRLNETQLRDLQATVKRKTIGANVGVRAGVQGAVQSYGLSLFGSAVSVRRLSVNEQRMSIIKARMKAKGWDEYSAKKRDYFAPMAATAAVAAIMPGVDGLIGHMAGHAANHVATTAHAATAGGAHHAAGIANAVAAHPGTAARAIEHGAEAQINELTRGAVGHAAVNVAPVADITTLNSTTVAYAAGEALARAGEQKAVSSTIAKVTDIGIRKTAAATGRGGNTSKKTHVTVERVPITPSDDGITFEFVDEPWNPSAAASRYERISFEKTDCACAPTSFPVTPTSERTSLEILESAHAPEPILIAPPKERTSLEILERAHAPRPSSAPPDTPLPKKGAEKAKSNTPSKSGPKKDSNNKKPSKTQPGATIQDAIEKNNPKLIGQLVRKDARNANKKLSFRDEPPIVFAARRGKLKAAKALLESGASINRTDSRGYTALMVACEAGDHIMANLLVTNGANLHTRGGGKKALDIAKARKDDFICGMLKNAGA